MPQQKVNTNLSTFSGKKMSMYYTENESWLVVSNQKK